MSLSILPFVVAAEALFIRAPGLEEETTLSPTEKGLAMVTQGTGDFFTSGPVALLLLPALAVLLYRTGYRVAGPLLGLFAIGLFAARMLGASA